MCVEAGTRSGATERANVATRTTKTTQTPDYAGTGQSTEAVSEQTANLCMPIRSKFYTVIPVP